MATSICVISTIQNVIVVGRSTTLTFEDEYSWGSVGYLWYYTQADPGTHVYIGEVTVPGNIVVSPTENTTYRLLKYHTGSPSTDWERYNCETFITVNPVTELSCTFTSVPSSVQKGESARLSWTSTDATSGVINRSIGMIDPEVLTLGSVVVTPTNTTIYTLTVKDDNGGIHQCQVTTTVIQPLTQNCPCKFNDTNCFIPVDWTISYDPKIKAWISFHDWSPTLMLPSYSHFLTLNGNTIWRHNTTYDKYANYYNTQYPWEVEYPVTTGVDVTTLRSIEYTFEAYKFYNNGKDYHHILDNNFDEAIIYNSEQISGVLKLHLQRKNDPLDKLRFPKIGVDHIDITFAKEENKYRFNTFWDSTNDRGEFSGARTQMWNTDTNGYKSTINPAYINYNKNILERKKFRHYGNKVLLRTNDSKDVKQILKLTKAKQELSAR